MNANDPPASPETMSYLEGAAVALLGVGVSDLGGFALPAEFVVIVAGVGLVVVLAMEYKHFGPGAEEVWL